ncbi:hypothetical protein T265_04528 [Opisthorchis viverrini]|uniref:Uncharacterized protein n=1 Tax=Opisthorchis viverrini TaxID=6198 RepID=A0A074ZSE5_OPIVI|nr:hypothetical protein T265_04528 [Opisthorchis viverrini]KER28742.1 hypothetical protein T265_04528 [Opisthorchis viverrini]
MIGTTGIEERFLMLVNCTAESGFRLLWPQHKARLLELAQINSPKDDASSVEDFVWCLVKHSNKAI